MFGDYTSKLNTRKDQEAKKQAEYDNLIAQIKLQQENYQKQLIAEQKKQEEEYKKKLASMETSEKVYRVFTISGFGVYNCDSPQSYPKEELGSLEKLKALLKIDKESLAE